MKEGLRAKLHFEPLQSFPGFLMVLWLEQFSRHRQFRLGIPFAFLQLEVILSLSLQIDQASLLWEPRQSFLRLPDGREIVFAVERILDL